jgi:hypothetical protein
MPYENPQPYVTLREASTLDVFLATSAARGFSLARIDADNQLICISLFSTFVVRTQMA